MDTHALMVDLATYLSSMGVGTLGVSLFAVHIPANAPQVATVVYPSGGANPVGTPVKSPTFGIQHRNTNVNSGLSKVTEINSMLDEAWNILDSFTGRIMAQSAPGPYVTTNSNQFLFTLNYALTSGQ
jgi:hypothetical protein